MEKPVTYAQWLRRERKARGITQRALAEKANLGKNYVTVLEGGTVDLPTDATRAALHLVLGTRDKELIDLGIMELDPFTGEGRPVHRGELGMSARELAGTYDQPGANPFGPDDPRWRIVELLREHRLNDVDADIVVGVIETVVRTSPRRIAN